MDARAIMRTLTREREKAGLTVDDVAKRAGWKKNVVERLEGPGANPTLASITIYAQAVGAKTLSLSFEREEKPRVLTFFNHAGGVGKSVSVRDIGFTLSQLGFKVLLIDVDPQANLTYWLGVRHDILPAQTIMPAVESRENNYQLPEPIPVHGMGLIPSTVEIARLEPNLSVASGAVLRLNKAVNKLTEYDFVLIDPPPNLGQLSAMATFAARYIVVPLPTDIKGIQGVKVILEMLDNYREIKPDLRLLLFLLTHYQRTNQDRDAAHYISGELSQATGVRVSSPIGHRPAVYKEASLEGVPVPLITGRGEEAKAEIDAATSLLLEELGITVHA
jgi:chromosome partitioning protein